MTAASFRRGILGMVQIIHTDLGSPGDNYNWRRLMVDIPRKGVEGTAQWVEPKTVWNIIKLSKGNLISQRNHELDLSFKESFFKCIALSQYCKF